MARTSPDGAALVTAWVFEVDPREVDLVDAFADGEAIAHFEVADDDRLGLLGPGQPAQAEAVTAHPLDEGVLSSAVTAAGADLVVLPALEVRLPDDTLLVVAAEHHDGYTVVRGTPDLAEVQELPEEHRTFIDAVEYVAAVAEQGAAQVPVSHDDDDPDAVAIFDAEGGLYVVVKRDAGSYELVWADDDGSLEVVDGYASLCEAILLPVLDEELFGER